MGKVNLNGGSLSTLFNKWVFGACTLLMALGSFASASANYDPCCDCEMNKFSLYADFIYWQIHPEGTEFARINGISAGATTNLEDDEHGRILSAGCEFQPGFRIGGIFDLGCCDWDAYAQYTFLVERLTNTSTTEFGESGLVPLIFNQGGLADVNLAKADWQSDFNALDFGWGRTFYIHCCYKFRPHFGFKATWQEYKYYVTYERINTTTVTTCDRILRHTDLDGIGLRSGFDASWDFSPCLSVVGGMAFSTLYSDLSTDRTDLRITITDGVPGPATKNLELKECHCVLVPVLELMAGIQFSKELCDCYRAFVLVGYEAQVWYGVGQYIQVQNLSANENNWTWGHENLTFHGLVLRAGVGY